MSLSQTTQDLELSQSNLTQTNQQLASTQTQLTNTEQQRQQAEVARQQAEQGLETAEDALQQTNQELNQALEQTAQANTSRDEAVQQAEQADREKQQAQQQTRIAQQERQAAEQQREEAVVATRLERTGNRVLRLFESGQEIEALLLAMQSGKELRTKVNQVSSPQDYPSVNPLFTLQRILDRIQERNFVRPIQQVNTIGAVFSPNNQLAAAPVSDNLVKVWNFSGQQLAQFEGDTVWFSPDGKHIATKTHDRTIVIWDLVSKRKVSEFPGLWYAGLEFSPDGQKIAFYSKGDSVSSITVSLWNIEGQKIKDFNDFENNSGIVFFSPDSNYFVLNNSLFRLDNSLQCNLSNDDEEFSKIRSRLRFSYDGQYLTTYNQAIDKIELWNSSCQRIQQFDGTDSQFSPDGQYLVTSWKNNTDTSPSIVLWDLSGQQLARITGSKISNSYGNRNHRLSNIVAFSPQGNMFAIASEDNTKVEVWNTSGQKTIEIKLSDTNIDIYRAVFSPDEKYLATSHNGQVRIWNLQNQQLIKEFEGKEVLFSHDARHLILEKNGQIRFFDLSGQKLRELKGNSIQFRDLKMSENDQSLVTNYIYGHLYGLVRFWDISDKSSLNVKLKLKPYCIDFSPDGKYFMTCSSASGSERGNAHQIELWDTFGKKLTEFNTSSPVRTAFSPDHKHFMLQSKNQVSIFNLSEQNLKEFDVEGKYVQFTPDGQHLLTVSETTVQKWTLSGQLIKESNVQFKNSDASGSMLFLQMSPDAQHFAASIGDNKIGLWDSSGRWLREFEGYRLKFSPDGQHLVTSPPDGNKIRLWNLSGQLLREFDGLSRLNPSMSFSPDGQSFAILLNAQTITLGNLSAQQLTQLRGEQGQFENIRFSPDGERFVTTSCLILTRQTCERIVQVWDLSGRKLAEFDGHSARFSPDGKRLAVARADRVKLWRIGGLDELLTRGCDWLEYYFVTHPEDRQEFCPNKSS